MARFVAATYENRHTSFIYKVAARDANKSELYLLDLQTRKLTPFKINGLD